MPRSVRLTAMRIYALGWNHNYEYTDPVAMEDLCEWCELSRRQIYDHLCRLVSKGVLRYTLLDRAGLRYVFDLWPTRSHAVRAGPSAEIRTGSALSVVVVGSSSLSKDSWIPQTEEEQQQQVMSESSGGECEGGAAASAEIRTGESRKPDWGSGDRIGWDEWDGRMDALEGMGVLEPTRSELARLEHATVEYLEEWADWFLTQDGVGTGFVVCRVRDGDEAPALSREQRVTVDTRRRCARLGLAHGGWRKR